MWLCEYCDVENNMENDICSSCGKEKSDYVKEQQEKMMAQLDDEYENLCPASIELKRWGKIILLACFGIGVFFFTSFTAIYLISMWESRNNAFGFMSFNFFSILNSFISMARWAVTGIVIKLALDALAIIVQSSHLNIKSKEGE